MFSFALFKTAITATARTDKKKIAKVSNKQWCPWYPPSDEGGAIFKEGGKGCKLHFHSSHYLWKIQLYPFDFWYAWIPRLASAVAANSIMTRTKKVCLWSQRITFLIFLTKSDFMTRYDILYRCHVTQCSYHVHCRFIDIHRHLLHTHIYTWLPMSNTGWMLAENSPSLD